MHPHTLTSIGMTALPMYCKPAYDAVESIEDIAMTAYTIDSYYYSG